MHTISFLLFIVWVAALVRVIANLLLIQQLECPEHETSVPQPFVSIIVPARNEAREIENTIRAFLRQDYVRLEVIVVDDASSDQTADIARTIDDPRLTVIASEALPNGWLGKTWAMHQGSRIARGELLLFADADVRYEPDAVRAAVAYMYRDTAVAMVALLPRFEMSGFWENIAMPALQLFGFAVLPASRTRSVGLAVGAGTGNLVRREAYESAGGHEALKNAIVDDVGLARLLRRHGHITEAARADGVLSIRMYRGASEILTGFTKNAFSFVNRSFFALVTILILNVTTGLFPYYAALGGDAFGIGTVLVISTVRVILFANIRYRIDNAVLGHPLMTAFWAAILLRSAWHTGVRGEIEWRGRKYKSRDTTCFGDI